MNFKENLIKDLEKNDVFLSLSPYQRMTIAEIADKQLLIQRVSNRRDLLIACVRTCLKDKDSITVEQQVDNFLFLNGN